MFHLDQIWALPEPLDLEEIAEKASHAAFKEIADEFQRAGFGHTFGDFSPGEVAQIDRVFREMVNAMALNNPRILREVGPDPAGK
jgi:hypothetical protein